jgi:hypothetical protein
MRNELHCVMNDFKCCECKKVIKSCKCVCQVDFLQWIYFITSFTYTRVWHACSACSTCILQFSKLVMSELGHIGDDEQELVTGRQSFMKLLFLLGWQLYCCRFTLILWNYLNYFDILFFQLFSIWSRQYCFKDKGRTEAITMALRLHA